MYISKELRKKRNHDKLVLMTKYKLNTITFLILKNLIDTSMNHNEFVSVINVLKEHDDTKGTI